jgi:hypothetical protein
MTVRLFDVTSRVGVLGAGLEGQLGLAYEGLGGQPGGARVQRTPEKRLGPPFGSGSHIRAARVGRDGGRSSGKSTTGEAQATKPRADAQAKGPQLHGEGVPG